MKSILRFFWLVKLSITFELNSLIPRTKFFSTDSTASAESVVRHCVPREGFDTLQRRETAFRLRAADRCSEAYLQEHECFRKSIRHLIRCPRWFCISEQHARETENRTLTSATNHPCLFWNHWLLNERVIPLHFWVNAKSSGWSAPIRTISVFSANECCANDLSKR